MPPQWMPGPQMQVGGSPGYVGIPSNMRVVQPQNAQFYSPGQLQRYGQVTSPGSTFAREMERVYTPWGRAIHDPPVAGYGTGGNTFGDWAGAGARQIPKLGGAIGAWEAANATKGAEGTWRPNPEEGGFSRGLGVISNILGWLGMAGVGGQGLDWASKGVQGIQGLMKAPEVFKGSWGESAANTIGQSLSGMADRTGIIRNGGFSPWSGGGASPPNDLQTIFGGIPSESEGNFAAQGPRDWSQERGG